MKKLSLAIAVLLMPTMSFAAGVMKDVSQKVNIDGAKITTTATGMGGGTDVLGGTVLSTEKTPGNVTIGEISNDEGEMHNVNQEVSASGAEITAGGGSITVGRISNK